MAEVISAKLSNGGQNQQPSSGEVIVEITPAQIFGVEYINPQMSIKYLGIIKKEDLENEEITMIQVQFPEVLVFTLEQQTGPGGQPVPGSQPTITPVTKPIKIEEIDGTYKIYLPKSQYVFDIISENPLDVKSHKDDYKEAVTKIRLEAMEMQAKLKSQNLSN